MKKQKPKLLRRVLIQDLIGIGSSPKALYINNYYRETWEEKIGKEIHLRDKVVPGPTMYLHEADHNVKVVAQSTAMLKTVLQGIAFEYDKQIKFKEIGGFNKDE